MRSAPLRDFRAFNIMFVLNSVQDLKYSLVKYNTLRTMGIRSDKGQVNMQWLLSLSDNNDVIRQRV